MTLIPFAFPKRWPRWLPELASTAAPQRDSPVTRPSTDTQRPQLRGRHDRLAATLAAHADYRVLRRLEPRSLYEDPQGLPTHTALYVDVETTGLDQANDHIIQLAVVQFTFTSDGRVCAVAPSEAWYEDPGVPICPAITLLTGISDENVAGHRIDEDRIGALLQNAALIVAHNAAFDRPFLEKRFPRFAGLPWACSMGDIPWLAEGLPTTKLEWLAERHCAVFYDAHRADADCRVGVHLVASTLPSGRRAMDALLTSVRNKTVRLWATGAPFSVRGSLKARGYRWNGGEDGNPKAWYRDVRDDDLPNEAEWLREAVYRGGAVDAKWQRFGARTRYSTRLTGIALRSLAESHAGER